MIRDTWYTGWLASVVIMVMLLLCMYYAFKVAADYDFDRYGPVPESVE